MNSKAHDLCGQAAQMILSGEWANLPVKDSLRDHIESCSECQNRIEEVRFFGIAFSTDEPQVFLKKKQPTSIPIPTISQMKGTTAPWLGGVVKISAFAAAACFVAFFVWNYFQPEGIGRVAAVEGEATIRRFKTQTDKHLSEGMRVHEGDFIRTAMNSKLHLLLEDSNHIHLNESTEIRIEGPRLLHHKMGETWFEVAKGKGEFEVETRGADVMVLGTAFGIRYSDDEVTVPVTSGKVRLLTKGGEIDLEPGHIGTYSNSKPYLPPSRKRDLYTETHPQWLLVGKVLR